MKLSESVVNPGGERGVADEQGNAKPRQQQSRRVTNCRRTCNPERKGETTS